MPTEDNAAELDVDLESFAAAYEQGTAAVLDVRNPDEYEAGHIPGAVLIPLPELGARQGEIPDGDPVYVVCAVGGRSRAAAQAMEQAGYRARSVAGGTKAWIEQGRPYLTGPERGSASASGPRS
jgi:rhodanese-related sulfurtransferase